MGFVLAMVVVVGGIVLIALGKDVAGLAALITAVVSLVGLFIYRERSEGATEGQGNAPDALPQTAPPDATPSLPGGANQEQAPPAS